MSTMRLIEYEEATDEVRKVYDDIMATRKIDKVNNFWKALANHPVAMKRTWESLKQIMAPGALDPLTKEMIYLYRRQRDELLHLLYRFAHLGRAQGWDD